MIDQTTVHNLTRIWSMDNIVILFLLFEKDKCQQQNQRNKDLY